MDAYHLNHVSKVGLADARTNWHNVSGLGCAEDMKQISNSSFTRNISSIRVLKIIVLGNSEVSDMKDKGWRECSRHE